jgi:hypothetical protein
MTLREISKLPAGTKVYEIVNGEIRPYTILAFDVKDPNYFYLISGYNHCDAVGHYLPTANGHWEEDYDKAKQAMWFQNVQKLKSKNEIYFEGKKDIDLTKYE